MGKLLCRIGLHRWRDAIVEGVNIFAPIFPKYHVQECTRCKKCRRFGHTIYGSVVYKFDNLSDAKASFATGVSAKE